jgi:hypothetical protein
MVDPLAKLTVSREANVLGSAQASPMTNPRRGLLPSFSIGLTKS